MICRLRRFRGFITAFLVTLIVCGAALGLAGVDFVSGRDGFGGMLTDAKLSMPDPLHCELKLDEWRYILDLTALNELELLRRDYEVYTMPRSVRLAARWITAVAQWRQERLDERREEEYKINAGLV